jgi:ubiquinone/menaquinone biosynthesis C-methylase UbiE
MKTEWDYTELADAYLKRPDYSVEAIDALVRSSGAARGDAACDVGAGVAHLTLHLARRGFVVDAVEPNDAMRRNGVRRTAEFPNVAWHEGTGEATGRADARYKLVTFGSSFNVTDRPAALKETGRLLAAGGWFACMWNHRDLSDRLQNDIEDAIKRRVPAYGYGSRREDQTGVINASGLFGPVERVEGRVIHKQSVEDCLEAWRSHATLERQAKGQFKDVVEDIRAILKEHGQAEISIPYTTRVWLAPVKK